jgi:hypothetical protein
VRHQREIVNKRRRGDQEIEIRAGQTLIEDRGPDGTERKSDVKTGVEDVKLAEQLSLAREESRRGA